MNPVFEAFELAAQYRRLAELLAEQHDDPQLVADTLESISGPLDEQLENLAKMVRNVEAAATGVQRTIEGLQQREAALQRTADRGRKLILDLMQAAGREKATTALFALALRKNPPAVIVDDEKVLPEDFLIHHPAPAPSPNKKAIASALKAGVPVPGVHIEQGLRLEIQ